MEDRRVDGIRDHDRVPQLETERLVFREAVARLQDRRVRQRVDLHNAGVRAVVEPAIRSDRPVDAMHHAHTVAGETAQPPEIEVERVVEAARRVAGDTVDLDCKPPPTPFSDEREEELVAAAVRRGVKLVEDGHVAASRARARAVDLRLPGS
jgi:hypothetical protein